MCVMTTAHIKCFVCDGLSVRTCNSKVWIYTLCEACSVMLRGYSPCAWFVESRPNPISRRASMTRNRTLSPHNLYREPFLWCARASTQRWRKRRSKRRDSRFVFVVRASRWWEVVPREVVLWARLFERNCSREIVLRKTVLRALAENFSGRNCSTRSCSVRGRSKRSGSAKAVAIQRTFSDCASAQPRRRYSYFKVSAHVLRTKTTQTGFQIEDQWS